MQLHQLPRRSWLDPLCSAVPVVEVLRNKQSDLFPAFAAATTAAHLLCIDRALQYVLHRSGMHMTKLVLLQQWTKVQVAYAA